MLRAVWAELQARRAGAGAAPAPAAPARRGDRRRGRRPQGRRQLRVVEPAEHRGRRPTTWATSSPSAGPRAARSPSDDTFVSQLHARVFRRDGQLYVEDLGSTNGTYLNRKKVTAPVAVRRGDRLQVGKTVLEVCT